MPDILIQAIPLIKCDSLHALGSSGSNIGSQLLREIASTECQARDPFFDAGVRDIALHEAPLPWRGTAVQELELKLERLGGSDALAQPHNYMPKSEHARLLDARLATAAAEAQAHLQRQLNEACTDTRLRVEAQAEEASRLELRHLCSRHEEAEQEVAKLHDRLQELHEKLEAANGDLLHAKASGPSLLWLKGGAES